MEITSSYQLQIFLYSCIFGLLLGAYYSIFKIVRIAVSADNRHVFISDIIYMLTSAVFTFMFLLAFNFGEIRFYLIAGEIIGFCAYALTADQVIMFLAKFIISFINNIINFIKLKILIPLLYILIKIMKILLKPIKFILNFVIIKIKKVLKKLIKIRYTLKSNIKGRVEK